MGAVRVVEQPMRVVATEDVVAVVAVAGSSSGDGGGVGPRGATGPTGPAGAAGANGATGATGAGATGATGAAGTNGSAGAVGATGSTGPAGSAGAAGATGTAGSAGSAGATGATGPAGVDGASSGGWVYLPVIYVSASVGFVNYLTNGGQHPNFYRTTFNGGGEPDKATAYLEWSLWLDAGTWEIVVHAVESEDAGIYTVSLDGTDVFSKDAYKVGGGIAYDVLGSGSVVVASAGVKALRLRANGKNVSSSDVYQYITDLVCRRTA